jgi:hypothetical protein
LSAVAVRPTATAGSTRRPAPDTMWSLGGYTVLSLLLFGLPVLGHFGSRIIASDAIDSSQFMWFFAWWPHAIIHGLNPFVTHEMFVPSGFNLTWSTTMPGPSILLSPVTLAFGPAVTWNVIQLACPALSAWTMFLLCRHITGRLWPSLAGGYLFGFSPYMLIHLTGGPYLALVPLLPVFVLLVLKRIEGTIGRRGFVIAMALGLTAQYSISSEVLASGTFFGAVALLIAYALMPDLRRALIDVVKLLVPAYIATAVLISPFLYFFFFGHHYPPGAIGFSADLGSFATPPTHILLSRQKPIAGSSTETYLGIPLIVLLCVFAWQHRRSKRTQLLAGSLIVSGVASLGAHLFFHGHKTSIPGPWLPFSHLPLLHYALPTRFAVFTILPAAVILALWLSEPIARNRAGLLRVGLAALAVVAIFPDVGSAAFDTHIKDPPFFSTGEYKHYLTHADNVLTVPVWGPNERWQADTHFYFRLSDGYAGNPFPAAYTRYPIWNALLLGSIVPNYAAEIRSFVRAKQVTAIVVDETQPGHWRQLFAPLGVKPISTGGVLFYRLRAPK